MGHSKVGDFFVGAIGFVLLSWILASVGGFLARLFGRGAEYAVPGIAIACAGISVLLIALLYRRPFLVWGMATVVAVPIVLFLMAWYACMNAAPGSVWHP